MPRSPARPARTPRTALAELLTGNRRFVSGRPVHGHDVTAAAAVASGDQQPYAVLLGCIDSRVPLEAIFDQTFGSICVIRTGAHVLDRAVRGSIEFVVEQLGVTLVMVLGHERCGAVASTVESLRTGRRPDGDLGYVVDRITPAVTDVGPYHPAVHPLAVRRHVCRTVRALRADELLAGPVAAGKLDVVGALYDLDTGEVTLLEPGGDHPSAGH
ncbi:carbonic anhydrase [Micromonospora sp. WMMD714]|uniref:carbonic anhydrase n=1 Tax=Micromonospora sp. WMMD714 TaxID=3016097 RepID=UPI00249BD1FE|nr:carbonic anhydrase [Micromonospora sp. WMMD714]WFE67248.1 carbonic anhydrase [Micromonospora sp. WMMD714]